MSLLALPNDDGLHCAAAAGLLRGLNQRHGLTFEQMIREAGLDWRAMRLWRLANPSVPFTLADVAPFVPLVARHTAVSCGDVWTFLRRPDGRVPTLHELAACRFWSTSAADMAELTSLVSSALSRGASWVYAGRVPPLWVAEAEVRGRCVPSVLRRAGVVGRAATSAWQAFFRDVHLRVMPLGETVPINGLVLTLRSHFLDAMEGRWPMDRLSPAQRADFTGSLAFDAVLERGLLLGLLEQQPGDRSPTVVGEIDELDTLLLVENQFVLKRATGSAVWATCERTGHGLHDGFIDEHRACIDGLKRQVKAPLDVRTSFELIAHHLFGGDEHHPGLQVVWPRPSAP